MFSHAPVVEHGGAAVVGAKSFVGTAWFTHLLSEVDHHRSFVDQRADCHRGDGLPWITGKELRSNPLLVVVLEEMQHVLIDAFKTLLNTRHVGRLSVLIDQQPKGIVKLNFVVEIIESTLLDV